MSLLKQSTARDKMVFMTDSADHITGKTSLTLTITASKNGAAFASISPTVTERGSGWYSLALTTSHTDTLGDLALHVTSTGADPSDLVWQVVAGLPGESVSLQADQAVNVTKFGGTTVTARDIGASVLISSGTGAGQLSVTSGVVSSNMTQIDGLATNGNNATLNLKQLNVVNNAGDAIVATSTGSNGNGASFTGDGTGNGLKAHSGSGAGILASTNGSNACKLDGGTGGYGLHVLGGSTGSSAAYFHAQGSAGTCAGIIAEGSNNTPAIYAIGAGSAAGVRIEGGTTGNGLELRATNGTALSSIGDTGALFDSVSANGSGLIINGRGTEPAASIAGGATGDGITVVGGNGVDIRADITGSISSVTSFGAGSITDSTLDTTALQAIRNTFLVANSALNSPTVGTNTVTLDGSYGANNDALNGLTLAHFTPLNELVGIYTILDYDNSTFTVTVDRPWIVAPVDSDRIRIYEFSQGVARVNIRKGLAFDNFPFRMYDSTNHAPATGATVTAQISKDNGAYAACTNSVTEVGNGKYRISLTASETNANVFSLKFTATSCDQQDIDVVTQE